MKITASRARSMSAFVEHDHRVLAPELEVDSLEGRRALGLNSRTGDGLPDESNGGDGGVLGERLAGGLTHSVHDIEHAGRETGLQRDLGQQLGRERLHSAGLCTTVQPAARAGAIFHVDSMKGVFQGVITPTGPTGSATWCS